MADVTTNVQISSAWTQIALAGGSHRIFLEHQDHRTRCLLFETDADDSPPSDGLDGWPLSRDGLLYTARAGAFLWARVSRADATLVISPTA